MKKGAEERVRERAGAAEQSHSGVGEAPARSGRSCAQTPSRRPRGLLDHPLLSPEVLGVAGVGVSEAPQEEGEDATGLCFPHGGPCKWTCWERHTEHWYCRMFPPVCLSTRWAARVGFRGRNPALLPEALQACSC